MFKFMNTRLLINMSATTDTLKSPLRQAMQRMTNQSYQEYWEGLIADTAQGDAATLVRENVDHKRIVFFFPAGAGSKHTSLNGRADSDQLAANAEIAAQHGLAAAHAETGGDAGKFLTDHCGLGVGIPAVISTAIERQGLDPFVCHAIYTSAETFAALPDAVKTGEGGCTINFTPPQLDHYGKALPEQPELRFSLCTIKNIESVQLWRDGEAAGRGKAIWRLVKHERTTAMAFLMSSQSSISSSAARRPCTMSLAM